MSMLGTLFGPTAGAPAGAAASSGTGAPGADAGALHAALFVRLLNAFVAALTDGARKEGLDDPDYCGSEDNFWAMVASPCHYACLVLALSERAPSRWASALALLYDDGGESGVLAQLWDNQFDMHPSGGMTAARYIPTLTAAERAALGAAAAEPPAETFRAFERLLDKVRAGAGDANTRLCRFRGPVQDYRDAIVRRLRSKLEWFRTLAPLPAALPAKVAAGGMIASAVAPVTASASAASAAAAAAAARVAAGAGAASSWTPLHILCACGVADGSAPAAADVAAALLDLGADVNARTPSGNTPLTLLCCHRPRDLPLLRLLLQRGADANGPPAANGFSALAWASSSTHGCAEAAAALAAAGGS